MPGVLASCRTADGARLANTGRGEGAMRPRSEVLGILQPVGGGDPIPLNKPEMIVGRRPSCDIQLDFENISGKHCMLRIINGVWNVKDLGSTNGTTVNGSRLATEQSVMPDEEIGFAGHMFTI